MKLVELERTWKEEEEERGEKRHTKLQWREAQQFRLLCNGPTVLLVC